MSIAYYEAEMEFLLGLAKEVDIIISCAAVKGSQAPRILSRDHVDVMRPGSVLIDLTGDSGGTVEILKVGDMYRYRDRTWVLGFTDLTSRLATEVRPGVR